MEPQESVVTDDSDETFTQDEIKINDKYTYVKNKINVSNNPFYNLIERQAKEFEEFGKRMSLELQNSYNEYAVQQKEMTKVEADSIEIEKIYKILEEKFEGKFASQSQLIDSLRARIEELETDSIIKEQNIKKLQSELSGFKKGQSVSARDNTNGNDKDERKFVYPSCPNFDNETFEYLVDDDYSSSGNYAGPPICYQQVSEDEGDYEEKENFSRPSTSYQQSNYENYFQYDSKHPDVRDIISESEQSYNGYNFQSANNNNSQNASKKKTSTSTSTSTPTSTSTNQQSSNRKKSRSQRINTEIKENRAKKLLNQFSVSQLLEYEKSDLFKSLSDDERKAVKNVINDGLRIELTGKRRLTQPTEVYVSRRLIPPLPDGITSYTEFKSTIQYHALPNDKKKRLQKIN